MAETIMVVEDDRQMARELVRLLENYGYRALQVEDFSRAVEEILEAAPHLGLLDINLPVQDGYTVCRQLRQHSQVPIIIVTSRDTEMDELMGMNLGADDFVAKPYNPQLLQAHIARVLARSYQSGESRTARFGRVELELSRSEATCGERRVELTKNERQILWVLMRARGEIVSRDALIGELWQSDEFVDDNTLTVNVNRLRGKLAEIGVEGYLLTRRGQGYQLCE